MMKWLAEKIALYVLRRAQRSSCVSAREFEQWRQEYKRDFGKDFK